MRCIRCHRPLKYATESGMGPVCGKGAKPVAAVERDLFGFNVSLAAEAATARLRVLVEILAVDAHMAVRHQFAAARRRMGVWA